MGRKKISFSEWLKPDELEKIDYCFTYMCNKSSTFSLYAEPDKRNTLIKAFNYSYSDNDRTLLFKNLRKAWNTNECRCKQKETDLIRIRLKKSTLRAVKRLSVTSSIDAEQLIENLICGADTQIQQTKKSVTDELNRRYNTKFQTLTVLLDKATKKTSPHWNHIKLQDQIEELKMLADSQLFGLCWCIIRLGGAQIGPPNYEEKKAIDNLFQQKKNEK